MADETEGGGGGPVELAIFVVGGLAILIVLWYMSGGPSRTDLRGIFLSPPSPVGTGGAYGPQINPKNTNQNQ